jgi:hypothetical protein
MSHLARLGLAWHIKSRTSPLALFLPTALVRALLALPFAPPINLAKCPQHQANLQKVHLASGNNIVFRTSLTSSTGTAADTWKANGAWGDDIVAGHRNESSPVSYDRSSPISLTSTKTSKEKRKVAAGKQRATDAVDTFDETFYGSR